MSEVVKLRTRAQIEEEAASWTWRLDSDAVSAADRQAFDAWLRKDIRHRRAIDDLAKVWSALDGLAQMKRGEKIATFAGGSRWPAGRRTYQRAAIAAAVLAAVAALVWSQRTFERPARETQTVATAVGQQRRIELADGSIVMLNTNTILDTDLRTATRDIYLRQGEAHFKVAHDPSRPFLVHAGDAVVRAVGTQFEVRMHTDRHLDVVVDEGRVEVRTDSSPSEPKDSSPARSAHVSVVRALVAGQQMSTARSDYEVVPVSTAQLSSTLAWREGAVIFDGEPLSAAIAEIERYTDARIVVTDPQTAALRVGGRFRTRDVQAFFDALQTALPVTVRRAGDGLVYIDRRQ